MLRISQITHGMPSTYLTYSYTLNVIILIVIKVCTVVLFYLIRAHKVFFQIMFTGYNIMFIMLLLLYSGVNDNSVKTLAGNHSDRHKIGLHQRVRMVASNE